MGRELWKHLNFMGHYGRRLAVAEQDLLPIGIEADFEEVGASPLASMAAEVEAELAAPEVKTRWFPVGDLLMHLPRYLDDDSCPYASLLGRILEESKGQEHRLGHLQVSEPLYKELEAQDRRERATEEVDALEEELGRKQPNGEKVAELMEALYKRFNYSWLELASVIGGRR